MVDQLTRFMQYVHQELLKMSWGALGVMQRLVATHAPEVLILVINNASAMKRGRGEEREEGVGRENCFL